MQIIEYCKTLKNMLSDDIKLDFVWNVNLNAADIMINDKYDIQFHLQFLFHFKLVNFKCINVGISIFHFSADTKKQNIVTQILSDPVSSVEI